MKAKHIYSAIILFLCLSNFLLKAESRKYSCDTDAAIAWRLNNVDPIADALEAGNTEDFIILFDQSFNREDLDKWYLPICHYLNVLSDDTYKNDNTDSTLSHIREKIGQRFNELY